jgi:membrane peptidoglycan carboxypeptidase
VGNVPGVNSEGGERLQLGRDRGKKASPPLEGNLGQRMWQRYQRRRQRTKARVAAMSRGRRWARRGMITGTWLLGFIAVLMVAVIIMYYAFTDVPRPEDIPLDQVATIQFADGSTLARVGPVDRTLIHLDQVPDQVKWAVLAAEDRGFYSEPGVSIRGTIRAAISDIFGGSTQGGSGITQQYVKNAYLSDSQTLTRKLKELMIAVKLSQEYSKDQILEFYLNTVYFGRNTYGIEAASQAFFGEHVEQLTTAQGALLAALLRAPSYYDPAVHPGQARGRWQYVIDGMVSTGHLTQAQADQLKFPKTKPPDSNGRLGVSGWKSLLVDAVFAELEAHGITRDEVYKRGLTIRTTIDKKAQQDAVAAINQTFCVPKVTRKTCPGNVLTQQQRNMKNALVAINPADGGILAYYGGSGPGVKGYNGKIDYNDYAGNGGRPPGSSFKPYTLATALTQTLNQTKNRPHLAINSYVDGSYCKTIDGTKICNDPGDLSVSSNHILLSLAMKYSLNTTFDQLAFDVGPDNVAATAHAMGIATEDSNGNKTLVDKNGHTSFGIGIGDYPVTPVDQADGFATLANNGQQNDPYLVEKAVASDGSTVYAHKSGSSQAIDKKVANDVTLTLEPVAAWSGDPLANGRVSASKTGTEGISPTSPNNSDAWMVGYTPQVSTAVWVGTGYSRPIFNSAGSPEYGSDLPGRTWQLFMDTYLAGKPNLPMATQQMIDSSGQTPAPTPTVSLPPTTSSAAPSTSAKPTFTVSTGFPSPTRTRTATPTPTPTPSTSSPTPTPTPTPTTSSSTCTGVICRP